MNNVTTYNDENCPISSAPSKYLVLQNIPRPIFLQISLIHNNPYFYLFTLD